MIKLTETQLVQTVFLFVLILLLQTVLSKTALHKGLYGGNFFSNCQYQDNKERLGVILKTIKRGYWDFLSIEVSELKEKKFGLLDKNLSATATIIYCPLNFLFQFITIEFVTELQTHARNHNSCSTVHSLLSILAVIQPQTRDGERETRDKGTEGREMVCKKATLSTPLLTPVSIRHHALQLLPLYLVPLFR